MKTIIYKNSPVFFQNLIITVENMFVFYKKYKYLPFINPMKKIISKQKYDFSINDKDTLLTRLNEFRKYALVKSRYYILHANQYPKLDALDDISTWPLLAKKTLKKNTDVFYSSDVNRFNSRSLMTSGTTGSPMKIKVSVTDLQIRFKVLLKTMVDVGYNPLKPMGRFIGHDIADDTLIYRKDYLHGHYFLSAFHISEDNIEKYYNVIVNNAIETLEGYPSVIYLIAKFFEQKNYDVKCVKNIFTTAEKLHEYQKDIIERVFSCKVYNYYGSSEQSVFIFTCKEGRLHASDTTGYLEVLDANDAPVVLGGLGSMAVTSFTSHFMPLIRYKIGDACKLSANQQCNCDNGGLIIDEIIGRDEDIFQTVDGNYISRFSVVLKYLPEQILESQLVLNNSKLSVSLYYVGSNALCNDDFFKFDKMLVSKIGKKYMINHIRVDNIVKTIRGKKRAVIIED